MKVEAEFITSAAGAEGFPRDRLPEVAIIGRSNVGKSSLINAMVRRTLARTSAAAGKTRLANFYRVRVGSGQPLYMVDLPGYGYARGPEGDGAFTGLTRAYFDRPGHKAVLLLVDSRHPGLVADLNAWKWLRSQPFPSAIVGTKADKLKRVERVSHVREFESLFAVSVPLVSAKDGEGLDALWKLIARLPSPTAA
jgi:GTP-binding protein